MPREQHLDVDAIEELVVTCLQSLAHMAQIHGQPRRAARLSEAARLLWAEASDAPEREELTPRECEVAALVARGCSNRQIGQHLVVSERTVDTHVSHILRKLGLVARTQIAAWVVERQRRIRVVT
jgi:DNA-binding NarL/FixJ family response regulator